ncbi:MAG: hypothetical protein ACYTG7_04315 [Planctomycetota bacterium]
MINALSKPHRTPKTSLPARNMASTIRVEISALSARPSRIIVVSTGVWGLLTERIAPEVSLSSRYCFFVLRSASTSSAYHHLTSG